MRLVAKVIDHMVTRVVRLARLQHLRGFARNVPAAFLVLVAIVAVAAPWVSPHDPYALDLAHRLQAPTTAHPFGTDEVGRDLLARVLYGARPTILVAVSVIAIASVIGVLGGMVAGMSLGAVDFLIMRLADIGLSIPGLVVVMAFSAVVGPGMRNAIFGLAIILIPSYIRLARNQTVLMRGTPYVDAARTFGANRWQLLRRHILRNIFDPIAVQATVDFGQVILALSALSFIGLGVQPPDADWGAIMSSGRRYGSGDWWYAAWPGLLIIATAGAAATCGDQLVSRLNEADVP